MHVKALSLRDPKAPIEYTCKADSEHTRILNLYSTSMAPHGVRNILNRSEFYPQAPTLKIISRSSVRALLGVDLG